MRSHQYQVTSKEWFRLFIPTMVAALALLGLLRLSRALDLLPSPRPGFNVDQTVLVHQAEASRKETGANVIFLGDSSCLMDFSARSVEEQLDGEYRLLNLGTLSYVGFPTYLEILKNSSALQSRRVTAVVLLLHPEMLRGVEPVPAFVRLVEDYYAERDYCLGGSSFAGLSCAIGLESFRNRLLSRMIPAAFRGSYGYFYGFNRELERWMDKEQGSARDPHTWDSLPTQNALELRFSPHLKASAGIIKASLGENVRLLVGSTPIPESLGSDTSLSKRNQILQEWGAASGADAVLGDLPFTLPDALFATRTHLNGKGVEVYNAILAASLRQALAR